MIQRVQIESRSGGEPSSRDFILEGRGNSNFLASLREGEQVLSCKEPGGLFAACELGNGA